MEFKIGDVVKTSCEEKQGKIKKIFPCEYGGLHKSYIIDCDGEGVKYSYEVDSVEKLEDPKPKFKIGQRVKICRPFYLPSDILKGIVSYSWYDEKLSEYRYTIENEALFKLTDYSQCCSNILEKDLKLIEDPKPEWQPKFKVGDWVENEINEAIGIIRIINYDKKNYSCSRIYLSSPLCVCEEKDLTLFKPMQELKKEVANQKEQIVQLMQENEELESAQKCSCCDCYKRK